MARAKQVTHAAVLGLVMLIATSAHVQAKKKPKVPDTITVDVPVPQLSIEPAETTDYPVVRDVGGLRLELLPIPTVPLPMVQVELEQRTSFMGAMLSSGDSVAVWMNIKPFYALQSGSLEIPPANPYNLQMKLRITNHLGKLLRFQGIALHFAVDGTVIPMTDVANELDKVMVLPEKSWEGIVFGPRLVDIFTDDKTSGMLLVGIYDIVTETDEANNPTKRSNVEWIFSYEKSYTNEKAEQHHVKTYVTPQQAQSYAGIHRASDFSKLITN